jgi:hypothetical protein
MAALAGPAVASATLNLNGSFFVTLLKPGGAGPVCPSGVDGNQCGMMQLAGLGPADFIYKFGPTFDPTGNKGCFYIDGTFTIILQSDGSTISGPLTGVFCTPGYSGLQGRPYAYGNPFSENDSVAFTNGTGQFLGLHGTANYQQSAAGAAYRGTLIGTLVGD